MMAPPGQDPPDRDWYPPWWFVRRYNETHPDKVRDALDPMVLLAWHYASEPLSPMATLITSC
jgi:hypothetical protein